MERMVRLKIDCLALTRLDALHLLNRLLTNMAEDPNHEDNTARGGWSIGATYGSVTAEMTEEPNIPPHRMARPAAGETYGAGDGSGLHNSKGD